MESGFYPHILVPRDLDTMELVIRSVLFACRHSSTPVEPEQTARLVLRLYRMGLTDPEKLSIVVVKLMSHRALLSRNAPIR